MISRAIESINKIRTNPKTGYINTRIAIAALTIPAPMRKYTAEVSYMSLFLKPSTILTMPLANRPNPSSRTSHCVVSFGVKNPKRAIPIIAEPIAIFIIRDDLLSRGERTPLAILSPPSISNVISIKNRNVYAPSHGPASTRD